MCNRAGSRNSKGQRLRRAAGVVAASSATFAMAPALSLTHGHRVVGWVLLGLQVGMVCVAFGMLARAKRLG